MDQGSVLGWSSFRLQNPGIRLDRCFVSERPIQSKRALPRGTERSGILEADASDDGAVEVLAGHAPIVGCIAERVDVAGACGDPIPLGVIRYER